MTKEKVVNDYIVAVQMPDYAQRPEWKGSIESSKHFIWTNGLRFLRHYQLKAIEHLQKAVSANSYKESISQYYKKYLSIHQIKG